METEIPTFDRYIRRQSERCTSQREKKRSE